MQEQIHSAILEALKTLGIESADFVVDHPTDKRTRADYFSNVALVVAKQLKQSPFDVAMQIQAALPSSLQEIFAMVEVAPPGFINFHFVR